MFDTECIRLKYYLWDVKFFNHYFLTVIDKKKNLIYFKIDILIS